MVEEKIRQHAGCLNMLAVSTSESTYACALCNLEAETQKNNSISIAIHASQNYIREAGLCEPTLEFPLDCTYGID